MLTVRDHMALTLAATSYHYPARKVAAMRELLGYSEPRFWQVVMALLDNPEAERTHHTTVHRLRRLRDVRRAARVGHRISL